MQSSRNFKQVQSYALSDSITSLAIGKSYLAAGCLDDSLHLWTLGNQGQITKDTQRIHAGNDMGIVDVAFDQSATNLVISCMDSTLRSYAAKANPLAPIKTIELEVMMNWKVQYTSLVYTGGDGGNVTCYDPISGQKKSQFRLGDTFLTSLAAASIKTNLFAAGNNNGDVYVQNSEQGQQTKVAKFKHHYKLVRQLTFIDNDNKLLTASDDATIKVIDVPSQKLVQAFEGHKISVSSVNVSNEEPKLFYSTSFDKTAKCWDLRQKSCIATVQADSPLWDCKSYGKNLYVGGESGKLNVYTLG